MKQGSCSSSFPSTEEDLQVICDSSSMLDRFKQTLVGRRFDVGGRSTGALLAFMAGPDIWNVEGRVRGVDLGSGRFIIDFESEEDLLKVLSKRPCHFKKWTFALERWKPNTPEDFPNTILFWIKIRGVPLHYWDDATLRSIGRALGRVEMVDVMNARVHVEVDVTRPLVFKWKGQCKNGVEVVVSLFYEKLHRYCRSCNMISHEQESCPRRLEGERLVSSNRRTEELHLMGQNRGERLAMSHPYHPRRFHLRQSQELGPLNDLRGSVWNMLNIEQLTRHPHTWEHPNPSLSVSTLSPRNVRNSHREESVLMGQNRGKRLAMSHPYHPRRFNLHQSQELGPLNDLRGSVWNMLNIEQLTRHPHTWEHPNPSLSVLTLSPRNVRNSHREESGVITRSMSSLNGHMNRSPPRTYQNGEHRRCFRSDRSVELGREGRGSEPRPWTAQGGSAPPLPTILDWSAPRQSPIPPHGETNALKEPSVHEGQGENYSMEEGEITVDVEMDEVSAVGGSGRETIAVIEPLTQVPWEDNSMKDCEITDEVSAVGGFEDWFGLPIPPHGETNDVVIPEGEGNLFADEVLSLTWEDMVPDVVMTEENRLSILECEKLLMTDDDIVDYGELLEDMTLTFEQALSQEQKFSEASSQSLTSMRAKSGCSKSD